MILRLHETNYSLRKIVGFVDFDSVAKVCVEVQMANNFLDDDLMMECAVNDFNGKESRALFATNVNQYEILFISSQHSRVCSCVIFANVSKMCVFVHF